MTDLPHHSIRITDLFAGAGGLTEGLVSASPIFRPYQAVEIDLDAAATYQQNFIESEVFNESITDWVVSGRVSPTDIVVGGPPCQGFSTLGKQEANDEKNFLWHQYAEVVNAASPKYFIMENVPQFATSQQKVVFEEELLKGKLRDYTAQIFLVNAADYGAPQARKRMIILGTRKGMQRFNLPAPILFKEQRKTVREAFKGLSPRVDEVDLPQRYVEYNGKRRPGPFLSTELHITRNFADLSLQRFARIPPGGNRFDLPDDLKAPCWIKHTSGSKDVMGRLYWDRPSVTIRTEFNKPEKGRYLHPEEDRAITHLEAIRLMGFPDDFKWVGSKTSIAKQIGNAVPISLGNALGRQLAQLLGD